LRSRYRARRPPSTVPSAWAGLAVRCAQSGCTFRAGGCA
jgi:hypothetical protein